MDNPTEDLLTTAQQWAKSGRKVAIATVIETWGSAPRPVGSHLVIDADGNFEGSVSGGCVEGAVIAAASDVIQDGNSKLLEFGVADETAWAVGLSCGGRISVYVEKLPSLEQLNALRQARQAAVVITEMEIGQTRLVTHHDEVDGLLGEAVTAAFRSGKSSSVTIEDTRYFINAYLPAPRLVIIGAVHISQVLVQMAKLAGFDVSIIDPRTAFATAERFAQTDLVADWPEDVLQNRPLDSHTALVALTHDPKIDDFPLAEALRKGCFYVGALGSRKTHAARLDRLKQQGLAETDLAKIHGPIGLNIGAVSPAEIAVAILAEMIDALRSGSLSKRNS